MSLHLVLERNYCSKNNEQLVEVGNGAAADWKYVEEVVLDIVEPLHCPICLQSPVVARITQCGHVLCQPCFWQLLDNWSEAFDGEEPYTLCPLCSQRVRESELKPVSLRQTRKAPSLGQTHDFVLLRRYRQKSIPSFAVVNPPQPPSAESGKVEPRDAGITLPGHLDDIANFCAISVQSICPRAIQSADPTLSLSSPHPSRPCRHCQRSEVQQALESAIFEAEAMGDTIVPYMQRALHAMQVDWQVEKEKETDARQKSPSSPIAAAVHSMDLPSNCDSDELYYYFYQSADGSPIFLDSLSWRALLTKYDQVLSHLPTTLRVTVAHCSDRRREYSKHHWSPLAHLPTCLNYILVGADLRRLLTPQQLQVWEGQKALRQREETQRQRQRMASRSERKAKAAWKAEEERLKEESRQYGRSGGGGGGDHGFLPPSVNSASWPVPAGGMLPPSAESATSVTASSVTSTPPAPTWVAPAFPSPLGGASEQQWPHLG